MENTTVYPELSEKELKNARKTYRKAQAGRSKGFLFWLVLGVGVVLLRFLMQSQDSASIEEFSAAFNILGVLVVAFFIIGNFRSIKKYKAIKEKASQIDPALAAMFQQELDEEKAEAKRQAIENREREKERARQDAEDMRQEAKKLGKLIIKNIKEDMEDAWYDD